MPEEKPPANDNPPADKPLVQPDPPPNPPAAPATPPKAAEIVLNAKSARETELETKLEETEKARKKAETDAAYNADEVQRLKKLQSGREQEKKKPGLRLTPWHLPEDED